MCVIFIQVINFVRSLSEFLLINGATVYVSGRGGDVNTPSTPCDTILYEPQNIN